MDSNGIVEGNISLIANPANPELYGDGSISVGGQVYTDGITELTTGHGINVQVPFSILQTTTPSTPSTNYTKFWCDPTLKRLQSLDDQGNIIDYGAPAPTGMGYLSYAEDVSQTETTSTSFIQKVSFTTQNVPEGSYIIVWSYKWSIDTFGTFNARINLDDTTYYDVLSKYLPSNNFVTESSFVNMSLSLGTHTISLEYSTNSHSKAAKIKDAHLIFYAA